MEDRNRSKRLPWVACLLAVVCALGAPPASADVLSSADVLARTGRTIDAWAASWWQWAFEHPEVLGDTTGAYGPEGDVGGPVFFAEGSGGGTVGAGYSVPAGQYVLLPLATYLWTLFDPCADVACAADIVNAFVDGTTAPFATIDGVPVSGLASHVVRVDPNAPLVFQVDAGPIDPTGYGGILDAVEAGYWLMLEPLGAGVHALSFGASIPLIDPGTGALLGDTIELRTDLTLTAVPEPGALLLLGIGIVALAMARRLRWPASDPSPGHNRRFRSNRTATPFAARTASWPKWINAASATSVASPMSTPRSGRRSRRRIVDRKITSS